MGGCGERVPCRLLTEEELEVVTEELMARVEAREEGVRPEDLHNLHFNDSYIFSELPVSTFLKAWQSTPTSWPRPPSSSTPRASASSPPGGGLEVPEPRILCKLHRGALAPGQQPLADGAHEGALLIDLPTTC